MNLSIGIVGLPNVGKSSLFQALTRKQVDTSNYPFATIDPNVGVVEVPDKRLAALAQIAQSARTVAAVVEFVDIAGLVSGAHKGEGLGNKFLQHIRETQSVAHVVRAFHKNDVMHVAGTISPERDIDIINTELLLKDLETAEHALARREREARSGNAEAKKAYEQLLLLKTELDAGKRPTEASFADVAKEFGLLSAKPMLYVINGKPEETKHITVLPSPHVFIDIKEELEMSALSWQEQEELGFHSQLPELIRAAYRLLGLITFFTAGEKEARAWTIIQQTNARAAGTAIHSDFEEKFIRAHIISYEDFISCGGWAGARNHGKLRVEGRDYIVKDGDVIEFKI